MELFCVSERKTTMQYGTSAATYKACNYWLIPSYFFYPFPPVILSLCLCISESLYVPVSLFVSVAFFLSPLSNYFNHCAEMEDARILCIRINTRYIRMYFWCTWFTRMPRETYRRPLGSLLCLCDVFWTLINSLVCQSIAQNNASLATADVPLTTSSFYHFSPLNSVPVFVVEVRTIRFGAWGAVIFLINKCVIPCFILPVTFNSLVAHSYCTLCCFTVCFRLEIF